MSFGVFILPYGDFEQEVYAWKERIQSVHPNQPYTAHPPHLTLINLEVSSEDDAIDAIANLSKSMRPLTVNVACTAVFWEDLATGGHTLYFGLKKAKALHTIQQKISVTLTGYRKEVQAPEHVRNNNVYMNSFNKYGFPFVGEHWIPHFSVSSLRSEKSDPIIREFLSSKFRYSFRVKEVSLWHINMDEHTHLKTVKFR